MAYGLDVDKNFLKVIYYLISSDRKVEDSEMEKFNELIKKYSSLSSANQNIIFECEKQLEKSFDSSDYADVLKEGIDECLRASYFDEQGKRNLVWMLVNVAFSDNDYSDTEINLIRYVVRKLDMDKSYLAEMEDSVKALVALQNKKSWAENCGKSYNDVKAIIDTIEKDREILTESITNLVNMG